MFKDIPEFPNYSINEKGEVFNKSTKKFIKGRNSTGRGYISFILFKGGKRYHKFRHCLLMETFNPSKDKTLTVDHINGIPGDDRLENLEYVTIRDNIIRFYLNGKLRRNPVSVKLFKTNEIIEFPSHIEAAKYLKIHRYEMLRRIYSRFGLMFADFTMVKLTSDERDFPNVENIELYRKKCELKKECKLYNHITKEEKIFSSLQEAARFLGLKISSLTSKMKYYKNKIFSSGWEVKFLDDYSPWSNVSDSELKRIKSGLITSRPILAIKKEEIIRFKSLHSCARHFGYTPGGLNVVMKTAKNPGRNGYIFRYEDELEGSVSS